MNSSTIPISSFSVESSGRSETPQGLTLKKRHKDKAYVRFFKNTSDGFVDFGGGDGCFELGNGKSPV